MFERFTDRARRAVVLAQEEARLLDHNYIGTEHLLLGLIHQGDGVAARALESLEVSLEAARARVEAAIGRGQASPSGHIPFTPRAKKVLENALREALQLGHNYIGTEHILLGLAREGKGVAATVLGELGIDRGRVRARVLELIGDGGADPVDSPETAGGDARELVVESLMGEVRRLRAEVDHLRDSLEGIAAAPPAPRPQAVPPSDPGTYQTVLQCSFCSEPHNQVAKLVSGPGVYICDQCIRLCQEILDEEIPPDRES